MQNITMNAIQKRAQSSPAALMTIIPLLCTRSTACPPPNILAHRLQDHRVPVILSGVKVLFGDIRHNRLHSLLPAKRNIVPSALIISSVNICPCRSVIFFPLNAKNLHIVFSSLSFAVIPAPHHSIAQTAQFPFSDTDIFSEFLA